MPNVIGVRVHLHDTRVITHDLARRWYAEDDGYLRVTDAQASDLAVYAAEVWAWAELVHAEPEPQPEQPTLTFYPGAATGSFTWPYDPTSGTVSTDDAVEQAKHEAADHIRRAKAVARGEDLLGFVDELERTADVLAVVADGGSDAPHRERRVRTLRTIAARLRAIVQSDGEAAA